MRQKGFTLIELLAVIAILAILASLVLVATSQVRKQSRDTQRRAIVRAISQALEAYANDNSGEYPTGLATTPSALDNYITAGSGWSTRKPLCRRSDGSEVNWNSANCLITNTSSAYTITTYLESSSNSFTCTTGGDCR